jgi:tetratricopeptide (TPR) repeat protein
MPILLEAMAGERSRSIPSLRQFRNDASWGLESIVRKCLAPNPDQRYQRAEDLAEDLDRLLNNRPLKHAPELSRVEQMQKWVRRHPRLATSLLITTAAAGLLTLGGLMLVGTQAKLTAAQTRVESAEHSEAQQHKHEFQHGTLKALCLINTHSDLNEHIAEGREVCEQTLATYGILNNADWQRQSIWTRLNANEQRQIAEDARELLLALAGARVQLATASLPTELASVESGLRTTKQKGNSASVVQKPGNHRGELGGVSVEAASFITERLEALELLDRANAIHELPVSSAVWRAKAAILRQLGEMNAANVADQRANSIPPRSARDFHLLATAHLQSGAADRHLKAIAELEQAVRLDPKNYWSWMQKGLCHLERQEHSQALADFGVCIGLWPEFAWGHFNRGYALDQIGQKRAAIADYSAALERDRELIPAYHNRGLARLELGQLETALADFDAVIAAQRGDAVIQSLRGQALERLARHAEADAAFETAATQLESLPDAVRNQLACSYGFAVCSRLPAEAKRAFQQVPSGDLKYPEALYGLAMIAVNEERLERAVELFGKALTIRPKFAEARRFRAVLLARLQQFSAAISEINTALQSEPKSGATLYAAACVTSLASEHATNPAAQQQARQESLRFLKQALDQGYGQQAATDNDLAGLRQHPEFEKLLLQGH